MSGASSASAIDDDAQGLLPRLFQADILHEEYPVKFDSREVKTRVAITAYGIPFIKASDLVSLATGHENTDATGNHFRSIVKNHQELEHNNKQLQNHIEVILVCLWYAFGMPLVCLWYAFGMPLVCIWYAFGMPLVCL